MKTCTSCKEAKPLSEFGPNRGRGNLKPRCRPCDNAYTREWRTQNVERERIKEYRQKLRKNYGISEAYYQMLLSYQDGKCRICKTEDPGKKLSYFCVDHDHETGNIRGLLCRRCNSAMGYFGDNPELLQAAVRYLEKWAEIHETLKGDEDVDDT